MRFFTREWASGALSDKEWKQVQASYSKHIESLLPKLPEPIAALASRIGLHDGKIRNVVANKNTGRLTLHLYCGDLQVGYRNLAIAYSGVRFELLDLVSLAALARDRDTEIIYDELDIDEDENYLHRILFYPSGEISITFASVELNELWGPNHEPEYSIREAY